VAHITSPDSPFSISLDDHTGMPNSLTVEDHQGKITRTIAVNVVAEIGGVEKRHPTGGLLYENTEKVSGLVPSGQIRRIHKGTYDEYNQDAKLGQLDLTLHYRLFPTAPFFELLPLHQTAQLLSEIFTSK
jgi:hypothetical protein